MEPDRTLLDRLANKFLVDDGCWQWIAGKTSSGYGQILVNGKYKPAHRVLYELLVGPIPVGLQLDHLCRNRACVRPDHLEPVTQAENMRRGETGKARGAQQRAKTHCPAGHLYSGDNLYVAPRGDRICRTCQRANSRRQWAKQRKA